MNHVINIEGTSFEVPAVQVNHLHLGDVVKFRIVHDKLVIDDYGLEVKLESIGHINYTERLLMEFSIQRIAPMFILDSLVTDGHNQGLSLYAQDSSDELRLNNVYGNGDIFHKVPIFNSFVWFRAGRYNLRNATEEINYTDVEDMKLELLTNPGLVKKLLELHHFLKG